jgi:opacity protein-like surface antigen
MTQSTSEPFNQTFQNRNNVKIHNHNMIKLTAGTVLMTVAVTLPAQDKVAATKEPGAPKEASAAVKESSATAAKGWQKPNWLTELSIGITESYDNNVYGVKGDAKGENYSWVTMVSPKVGFNFAPLVDSSKNLQSLTLSYAPDISAYHQAASENNVAHRLGNTIKGKKDAFSYNLDNAFVYVDGDDRAPFYLSPDNVRSAYGTSLPRERREQIQDRAKASFQYDWDQCFVRLAASLLYYDLMTDQSTASGYQNYCDRNDENGGVDVGFKLNQQFAVTLGYRYGHQYQGKTIGAPEQSCSDYQRVLLGVEGKPLSWLTVAAVGGGDFRQYEDRTPIDDKSSVFGYGEASLTAEASANDTFAFKYKGYQWVSSTGRIPLFENSFDLSYKHKFGKQLILDLGGKLSTSDYNSGNLPSSNRNDWLYAISAGLTYNINKNLSANLGYLVHLGRNQQDDLTNGKYREYDRQVVSLGMGYKF